jgi:hypothetical protein
MEDLGVSLNSFETWIELYERVSRVLHYFNTEFCSKIERMGSEDTHLSYGVVRRSGV